MRGLSSTGGLTRTCLTLRRLEDMSASDDPVKRSIMSKLQQNPALSSKSSIASTNRGASGATSNSTTSGSNIRNKLLNLTGFFSILRGEATGAAVVVADMMDDWTVLKEALTKGDRAARCRVVGVGKETKKRPEGRE
jgi:hypothetical protein